MPMYFSYLPLVKFYKLFYNNRRAVRIEEKLEKNISVLSVVPGMRQMLYTRKCLFT